MSILATVYASCHSINSACQLLVFDSMFAYIKDRLMPLSTFSEWQREPSTGRGEPQFSLTPQVYVKLIGEHLLLLPQLLEPYDHKAALESVKIQRSNSYSAGTAVQGSDLASELEWGMDDCSLCTSTSSVALFDVGTTASQTSYPLRRRPLGTQTRKMSRKYTKQEVLHLNGCRR
jgi:hypothetical protein